MRKSAAWARWMAKQIFRHTSKGHSAGPIARLWNLSEYQVEHVIRLGRIGPARVYLEKIWKGGGE